MAPIWVPVCMCTCVCTQQSHFRLMAKSVSCMCVCVCLLCGVCCLSGPKNFLLGLYCQAFYALCVVVAL